MFFGRGKIRLKSIYGRKAHEPVKNSRVSVSVVLFALFLGLVLVSFLIAPVEAYQSQVIYSMEAGKCSLTVESDSQSHTLRLRVHPEYNDCHIGKASMLSALKAAFSKTEPPKLEGIYSSLYIGRLIDYPWLSQYLATIAYRDPRWDKKRGKPTVLDINKYVANILFRKEITVQIEEAFAGSGYSVISTTVEKVLIGDFRSVPLYDGEVVPGKVPYDAQVWFRLEKK
jgi:hypothetical protein